MSINKYRGDGSGRRTPAKGVVMSNSMPLMLFCTVCASERGVSWVARAPLVDALRQMWGDDANAWLVGPYVFMPDHIHFLCVPKDPASGVSVEMWTTYWKSRLSTNLRDSCFRWQRELFHHRMRHDVELQETVDYMRLNPVKKGLVENAEDWPWQGEVHRLLTPPGYRPSQTLKTEVE